MSDTLICRILPTNASALHGNSQAKGASGVVTLDIRPASGAPWQLNVGKAHDLKLHFGDKIKCVSGAAAVMINPGTQAGMFVLCKQVPPNSDGKFRTELEITDELTRYINRGKIHIADDIGSVGRGTGATTR